MTQNLSKIEQIQQFAEIMIDFSLKEDQRLSAIEDILTIWEHSSVQPGLTSLDFKKQWAHVHYCMTSHLTSFAIPQEQETFYLNLWKRMVQQVIRHDGMEPLYRTFRHFENFKPVHLDFYLEQGIDVLSPEKQAQLCLAICCKSVYFFPQLKRFIEEGKLDLLMRSTSEFEFGTVGGFIIRESRHPAYIQAMLSTGIHPDKFWTAQTYHTINQEKEYDYASAFQYLCYDFSGKFCSQFASQWNENWYEHYIESLTLLLEHGADCYFVHPNKSYGYLSAIEYLDQALLFMQIRNIDERWKPCIEATQTLRTQFYDHRLHQKLTQTHLNHPNEPKIHKTRI